MASSYTEGQHTAEFLISEANNTRSREKVAIAQGNVLSAGSVVGQYTSDAATSTPGTNTGDGVMGAITVNDKARMGDYIVTIDEAVADAGEFTVTDPLGDLVGIGTVGVLFDVGETIAFTLADGATDFIVGDTFTIAVTEVSGKYAELDPSASNGLEAAGGILYAGIDTTEQGLDATIIVRDAEVGENDLQWGDAVTAEQQVTALTELTALGIIAREQG